MLGKKHNSFIFLTSFSVNDQQHGRQFGLHSDSGRGGSWSCSGIDNGRSHFFRYVSQYIHLNVIHMIDTYIIHKKDTSVTMHFEKLRTLKKKFKVR